MDTLTEPLRALLVGRTITDAEITRTTPDCFFRDALDTVVLTLDNGARIKVAAEETFNGSWLTIAPEQEPPT